MLLVPKPSEPDLFTRKEVSGCRIHAMKQTQRPRPNFNYELFNCNNFNIRYWSWNYRGCWPCLRPDVSFFIFSHPS